MIAVAAGYSWDINDIFRRLERNRPGLPDERGRPIIVVLHIAATDCVARSSVPIVGSRSGESTMNLTGYCTGSDP